MFKKWRLKDVILLAFLSIFFGGVFVGSGYLFEVLYGSQFGLGALLSGLVQGLGSEVGFLITKNRYESWLSLTANSIGITLFSFVYEYIKLGYYAFSLPFVLSLLLVRFASVFFFCAILVRTTVKLYHQFSSGSKA